MKKFILFLIVFVSFIFLVGATYSVSGELYEFNDIDTYSSVFIGFDRDTPNKAPITILSYPLPANVVSGPWVEFAWRYKDEEGDTQINYNLEIDDDPRFFSSQSYYGFGENNRKAYILLGDKEYFWRVRSKDTFGWGVFSEARSFYLDNNIKTCADGTIYEQCSRLNFKYCDNGDLIDNCASCGCPLNSECSQSGVCLQNKCFDRTIYGFCSNKKPGFCQNGNLKEVCSLCGCSEGSECNSDGTCSRIEKEQIDFGSGNKEQKKENWLGFFKFLRFLFN